MAGFQTFAYQPLSSVIPYLNLHNQTNPAKERLAWFHLWLVMQCDDDRMANGDTGLYRKFVESCMACASEHWEPLLEIHRGTKKALSRVTRVRKIFSYHILLSEYPSLTPGSQPLGIWHKILEPYKSYDFYLQGIKYIFHLQGIKCIFEPQIWNGKQTSNIVLEYSQKTQIY